MEERIIDDEYGRGVRLKKTEDGYVDVTDVLAEKQEEEEMGDEVSFEFPLLDGEDDEDLVGLSPEEALALRQKKAEAAAKRQAEYENACAEGEALLAEGKYTEAEKAFERALQLDEIATVASAGYWRAKTENFAKADVLAEEYAKDGIESLQYDLGYDATDVLRRDYHEVFQKRIEELTAEEKPLAENVEGKQKNRRKVILARLYKSGIAVALALLATVVFGILAFSNFADRRTVKDPTGFIVKACVFGALCVACFVVLIVFVNKLYNALRIHLKNERLSSTEEGGRLVVVRRYKALYEALAKLPEESEDTAETKNED
ncbi:MAG: hypothetical protein IJV83_04345 [Clostridia bacterium]|nr:hypothetical protein [Clostridia bacterium]